MRFSKIILTAAILALSSPAMAQMAAPEVIKDTSKLPGGIYKIDPRHTSVTWQVMHMGVSHYTARFDTVSGELNFNPADPVKSTVKISIPASSVNTGLPDFDKEIAGPKWLGGDKTPNITFDSTNVEKSGADTGKVTGNLTLNGVTKPVTLDVKFYGGILHPMGKGHDLGFSATTTFKRSDFGITEYIPMIGDDIKVSVETEFLNEKTPSPAEKK